MNWKKNSAYFLFQALRFARSGERFSKIWSCKNRWSAALEPGRNSVADEQAWLNFAAIDFLEKTLRPENQVFEYGGGGSTLFFLKHGCRVATVENDGKWFEVLTETVRQKGYPNWQGFFIEGEILPENQLAGNPANPADFATNAPGQAHVRYEKYARAIRQFPEKHFDVVLVDGRARPACIQESLAHLQPGGLLVVDNMERGYYWTAFRERFARDFETLVSGRFPTPYHPDFTETLVLRKI